MVDVCETMKTHWILYMVVALCYLIQQGLCANGTHAKNLRTTLFVTNGYDKKIRPTNNQTAPIEVFVSLNLLNINELSESTETLKITGFLDIMWADEFLYWSPADYGGIENYFWPQGDVWRPDVALKNSYLDYKELGASTLNVKVDSEGRVLWNPFQVFQSTCSINMLHYPYDVQTCSLIFVAWSYSKEEVKMGSGDKGIMLDRFEPSSAWDVLNTSYQVDWNSADSAVIFTIKLRRKPLYFLLTIIMPIIMLAILDIFVFVLPCESGEKASFAITVFLSFAVFMSIISSTLPVNSEVVAVFSIYLMIQTLQSTIITLLALLMIRCLSFDDDVTPVPRCLQAILRIAACRPCLKRSQKNRISDSRKDLDTNHHITDDESKETKGVQETKEGDVERDFTWKQAINMLDKIFFVFFALVLLFSTMFFFILTADTT